MMLKRLLLAAETPGFIIRSYLMATFARVNLNNATLVTLVVYYIQTQG